MHQSDIKGQVILLDLFDRLEYLLLQLAVHRLLLIDLQCLLLLQYSSLLCFFLPEQALYPDSRVTLMSFAGQVTMSKGV